MEDLSSFLDLPLDTDFYVPKKPVRPEKRPLKMLITEGNSKIAQNLIYKISAGEVFAPDQEVIFHLTYSRATKDPGASLMEFSACGFSAFSNAFVSSDPEEVYKDVDLVVAINHFEELYGYPSFTSYMYQASITLKVAKHMVRYGKKNCKLVLCGPSTKGIISLLSIIRQMKLKIPDENISAVTLLDETILKAEVAAKLKILTTDIKNVVIWGATHGDLANATAHMYPPGDCCNYEKVDVPLLEALQDDEWIHGTLFQKIHKRVCGSHLIFQGGAVATATAMHIKYLFQGSEMKHELLSMGVTVPTSNPYGLVSTVGFSLPVSTQNGKVSPQRHIRQEVWSYLANTKDEFNLSKGRLNVFIKAVSYFLKYKLESKGELDWLEMKFTDKARAQNVKLKCILTSMPRYEGSFSYSRRHSVGFKEPRIKNYSEASIGRPRPNLLRFTDNQ